MRLRCMPLVLTIAFSLLWLCLKPLDAVVQAQTLEPDKNAAIFTSEPVSLWNDAQWRYSDSRFQYFESYDWPGARARILGTESSAHEEGSTFVFYQYSSVFGSRFSYVVNSASGPSLASFTPFASMYLSPPVLITHSGTVEPEMDSSVFDQSPLRVLNSFSIEPSPLTSIKTLAKSDFRFVDTTSDPSLKTSTTGCSRFDWCNATPFSRRHREFEADQRGQSIGTGAISKSDLLIEAKDQS